MKKTIIYMIMVLICILLCSCERGLRLNPTVNIENEIGNLGIDLSDAYIYMPSNKDDCLELGHDAPTLKPNMSGSDSHVYICNWCGEIIKTEPHCDIKETVDLSYYTNDGALAVITKKCGLCYRAVGREYVSYNAREYAEVTE